MQLKKRRHNPIVDKALQYKLLALILTYGFVIIIFLAIFLLVPDLISLQDETLTLDEKAAVADRILSFHGRIWPAVIAIVCIIGLHSFRVFHRLVGPLYRFRWVFAKIRDGHLIYPIKIREKDYLHKEEDALNDMIKALVDRMEGLQRAGREAQNSLHALQQTLDEPDHDLDQGKKLLSTHGRHVETLLKNIQFFQVLRSNTEKETPDLENQGPSN